MYQVTGTYTRVLTGTPAGPRVVDLYAGDLVPADAPPQWIERQVAAGMIREVRYGGTMGTGTG